jgi:hypothetical protein
LSEYEFALIKLFVFFRFLAEPAVELPVYRLSARWRSLGAHSFFLFTNTFLATAAVVAAVTAGAEFSRNASTAAAFAWDEGPFLLAST